MNVSALWDAVLLKAVITFTASAVPDLQEYELRGSFGGTKYNAASANVLGNHLAGNVSPFQTDDRLVASGSKVFYKVFVVLTAGNEKGSRTVSMTKPYTERMNDSRRVLGWALVGVGIAYVGYQMFFGVTVLGNKEGTLVFEPPYHVYADRHDRILIGLFAILVGSLCLLLPTKVNRERAGLADDECDADLR